MATISKRRKDREKRRSKRQKAKAGSSGQENGKTDKKKLTGWRETLRFWIIAIAVIWFVRAFFFEPYRIPSESMEGTLYVRDFLIVSKLHYGPRTPATLGIPLTPIYVPGIEFPQTRLPGFSDIRRGDVIVFNYPASQDIVRGTVPSTIPIERRDPYIKRVIGIPGDTVAVVDKVVHLNGAPQPLGETMLQTWTVYGTGDVRPSVEELTEMGIQFDPRTGDSRDSTGRVLSPRQYTILASRGMVDELVRRAEVDRVEPRIMREGPVDNLRFPPGSNNNPHHFNHVVVPGEGDTVPLNAETWPGLLEIITRHEGHTAQSIGDSLFVIDGQPATEYTFEQDYYFAMGDNRDNSVDSRWWGFVPKDHVVGKAWFVLLSFDKWLPPIPRFSRFFKPIS
ncbi:MAG: signal peptidase I [Rubricoccaceae bacterium]|nr:signal peptidase I [Rubricoccaceae bacterium]